MGPPSTFAIGRNEMWVNPWTAYAPVGSVPGERSVIARVYTGVNFFFMGYVQGGARGFFPTLPGIYFIRMNSVGVKAK